MSPVIRVSENLYNRLAEHAEGFDSPANVIEKLLGQVDGKDPGAASHGKPDESARDRTKYLFNGKSYGKGRLVLAVISEFVRQRPSMSYSDLDKAFPKSLRSPHGPFVPLPEAIKIFEEEGRKRNFINPGEPIDLTDGTVAVSNQWGIKRMPAFLENAERLGIEITEAPLERMSAKVEPAKDRTSKMSRAGGRSLRGRVIDAWTHSNSPDWDVDKTSLVCIEEDERLEEENRNPARRFREARLRGDDDYIKQWTQGCRFEWL
jgi:hypothetical protein